MVGKVTAEAKKKYFEKLGKYKKNVDEINDRMNKLQQLAGTEENGTAYKKIMLADECINLVSYYIIMNSLSLELLGIKNEAYLNEARKMSYKAIIFLEEVVSPYVNVPFSDYEEKLDAIESFDDESRYKLIRKLGFAIQSIIEDFGENSKWKWSFVEIEARFATIIKNFLNLKTYIARMDPRIKGYECRVRHLELAKEYLQKAADGYRQKYELSTLRLDDFKLAINYLGALRGLHAMLGEVQEGETIKKKIEVWKSKMEHDLRTADQRAKEKRIKA